MEHLDARAVTVRCIVSHHVHALSGEEKEEVLRQGAGRGPGGRRGAGIWRQARLTEKILFLNSGSMMFMRAVRELEKSCADAASVGGEPCGRGGGWRAVRELEKSCADASG